MDNEEELRKEHGSPPFYDSLTPAQNALFLPGLECPESKQTTYRDILICNLNDKPCTLQEIGTCPTYEMYLNDLEEEMMEDTL